MSTRVFYQRSLLWFLGVLLAFQGISYAEENPIWVVFRYDDYSSGSATELEVRLLQTFQKHGIPCTFGVIPFVCSGDVHDSSPQELMPLTPAKAHILRKGIQAGLLEVALHGYSHQTIRSRSKGRTEFQGLSYVSAIKKMEKGVKYLEGIIGMQVTTFIPPWNSYDLNTLRAAKTLGFSCFSADPNGVSEGSLHLKLLPATCSLADFRDAVKTARGISDAHPIIVVLFHSYDFLEIGDKRKRGFLYYSNFVNLLDWSVSQEDLRFATLNQVSKIAKGLDVRHYADYQAFSSLVRYLPSFLHPSGGTQGVYWSVAPKDEAYLWLYLITTYLFLFVPGILLFCLCGEACPFAQVQALGFHYQTGWSRSNCLYYLESSSL